MHLAVLKFLIMQAFYDVRAKFGYNVVLLTDPRWIDVLAIELTDEQRDAIYDF